MMYLAQRDLTPSVVTYDLRSINSILTSDFYYFILDLQMDDSIPQSIYSIKTYGDRPFRLVTQNKNGPCPILAIYNLLALRGTIKIPATSGLSAENMMQAIGEVVLTGSSNQSELIEGKVVLLCIISWNMESYTLYCTHNMFVARLTE